MARVIVISAVFGTISAVIEFKLNITSTNVHYLLGMFAGAVMVKV